jgi:predicted ester cyclase
MEQIDRELGKRWFDEVWNKQRREAISEMLSPHSVMHEGGASSQGPEGFYPFFDRMQATFSDLHVTVHDTLAEGDKLCIRWSCTMKHTGDGLGMPPTGKTLHTTGISIVRVEGNKLAEGWQNWDMLGLLEQINSAPKAATYIA